MLRVDICPKIPYMNAVVLLKFDEKDQCILDYLLRTIMPLEANIHFIHVDAVSGEVPLKMDGSIIDNCTEFDLSKHYETVEDRKHILQGVMSAFPSSKGVVVAGNPLQFITYYTKLHEIDLILSGAHVTDWTEALQTSFAAQMVHKLNLPLLSVKSDRSHYILKTMGVVVDEKAMSGKDLTILELIARAHNAQIKWIHTSDHSKDKLVQYDMLEGLSMTEVQVAGSVHDHDFYKCTNEHNIDLLVVFREQPGFWQKLTNKETNDYLLNHLPLPLLIL
jgi:hypothetical protein